MARPDSLDWLILVYRIPTEPSRLRATVRRRLRVSGAVYLQSAVVALPDSPNGQGACQALEACGSALERFADEVYEAERNESRAR